MSALTTTGAGMAEGLRVTHVVSLGAKPLVCGRFPSNKRRHRVTGYGLEFRARESREWTLVGLSSWINRGCRRRGRTRRRMFILRMVTTA